jgi:hypothetical protein
MEQERRGDAVHLFLKMKEGEEARRLHGARGERHNEERCGNRGGRRRRLTSVGQR